MKCKRCRYSVFEKVGIFFKEGLAQYKNEFDYIGVIEKYKCKKCGRFEYKVISNKQFLPKRFYDTEIELKKYKEYLNSLGILSELEFKLKEGE